VINSLRRIPYIILTPLAAAFGVPRATLEAVLAVQWTSGLLGTVFGTLIERFGRKRIMLTASGAFTILAATGALGALGGLPALVIAAILLGAICKTAFDPAMHAYVGDRVPYQRRGMAVGITELAWSASLFIFGPVAAYLIGRETERAQDNVAILFGVIAACGMFTFVLVWRLVPTDTRPVTTVRHTNSAHWKLLRQNTPAMMLLGATVMTSVAAEVIGIGYEKWFRDVHALTTTALGTLSVVISAAEVIGEGTVIALADRVGKKRLSVLMLAGCGVASVVLPLMSSNLALATVVLFAMFLTFETYVVAMISLATEVLPRARGAMMSTLGASHAVGRAVGALFGGWLLRTIGFTANGGVALVLYMTAALIMWRFVVDHHDHRPVVEELADAEIL
jgi:predicted MFS family arabinose efflux permease